jgi:glycosyltransferase involved in cell wall biosynthesis
MHIETKKKILVITPRFPFDLRGACEQDRAHGTILLRKLGYEVHVIAMCFKSHLELISQAERDFDIKITPILYRKVRDGHTEELLSVITRICNPHYWDGAAFEYSDRTTQGTVKAVLDSFKPNLVWFDYTYLWPLYPLVKKSGLPIITRSINFEPNHFFNASEKRFLDRLKYHAKILSERKTISESDHLFAITPIEEEVYKRLGARHVSTLPLRRLGTLIGKNPNVHEHSHLNVLFMGSNYMVPHMMHALRFILDDVNPVLQKKYPNTFTIHIIGGKLPEAVRNEPHMGIEFHGYIPDLDTFMENIDIALAPSLSGEGMQQKVFEPIVRGLPTITSERALAGYPLLHKEHVLALSDNNPHEFVNALGSFINSAERRRISQQAITCAEELFSEDSLKAQVDAIITKLTSR